MPDFLSTYSVASPAFPVQEKAHLVQDVLYQNLIRLKGGSSEETPGICDRILGAHDIDEVILVDQSPLAQISKIDTSRLCRGI